VYHWIYGGLMRPTADGSLEPDLAESATVVDGRTIEVVLRDGLTLALVGGDRLEGWGRR
jgi:hypothetical protein